MIVSFVIGLGVLVPLRFAAEDGVARQDVQVLGAQTKIEQVVIEVEPTVAPAYQPGQLEAPYDQIDGVNVR